MNDTTIKKVDSSASPHGKHGEKYLVSGKNISMRLWEKEEPGTDKPTVARPYETIGYVLQGKAELHLEGQKALLEKGDSYLVPKNTKHTYKILETFSAVETTSPPAQIEARDS